MADFGASYAEMEQVASSLLLQGTSFEWTELAFQERQTGNKPILFLTDWDWGHHASANEIYYILKYVLWQSGHPEFQLKK